MARLWKRVNGEPYMINPRLGVLALQALNPPEKGRMAKHFGARHMAWVRSFRKNAHHKGRKHNPRRRRRNPYPLAGAVSAIGNPRKRRKHNPSRRHYRHNPPMFERAKGALGLPGLMPVVYGAGGFVGTAAVQGFIDTLVPTSMGGGTGNPTGVIKYAEIVGAIVVVSYVAKLVNKGGASMAAVGGGIYALQQAVHDFIPGVIPGMHAYTPLKAYTHLHPSGTMGRMRAPSPDAGGAMPQLASRWGMPQLAAQNIGPANLPVGFMDDGAMNVVQGRFRRFN